MKNHLSKIGDRTICPVAAIVRDGKILVGHRHYLPDKWKKVSVWTVPGGRCDPGETIEETLRREVKEEIGMTNLEIVDYLGEVPGAKEGDRVFAFFCKTDEDFTLMEPLKFSEWRWVLINDYINGAPGTPINVDFKELVGKYFRYVRQK